MSKPMSGGPVSKLNVLVIRRGATVEGFDARRNRLFSMAEMQWRRLSDRARTRIASFVGDPNGWL